MKFVVSTQTGEPVESAVPGTVAHRYTGSDGATVVVLRDARGRLLPGAQLARLQSGTGRPPTTAYSVTRRALGVSTRFAEHARRKKEGSK